MAYVFIVHELSVKILPGVIVNVPLCTTKVNDYAALDTDGGRCNV